MHMQIIITFIWRKKPFVFSFLFFLSVLIQCKYKIFFILLITNDKNHYASCFGYVNNNNNDKSVREKMAIWNDGNFFLNFFFVSVHFFRFGFSYDLSRIICRCKRKHINYTNIQLPMMIMMKPIICIWWSIITGSNSMVRSFNHHFVYCMFIYTIHLHLFHDHNNKRREKDENN